MQRAIVTRPYSVLRPDSVAYWMALAILADHSDRHAVRDAALDQCARVTHERREECNASQRDA